MTRNWQDKALHATWGVLCAIMMAGGGFVVQHVWAADGEIASNKALFSSHVAEDARQWQLLEKQLDRRFSEVQKSLDRIEKKVEQVDQRMSP